MRAVRWGCALAFRMQNAFSSDAKNKGELCSYPCLEDDWRLEALLFPLALWGAVSQGGSGVGASGKRCKIGNIVTLEIL